MRRALSPVLLVVAAGCPMGNAPTPVILVSIDTLRPDHLGCYGYPRPTSPALDAFRSDALLFRDTFSHAPSTLASHASLLTSLLPPHHGASIANDLAVPREALTLAEVLHARGYATSSFNGGIQLDAAFGLDQGFDVYQSVKPRGAPAESLVDPTDRFSHEVELARDWISRCGSKRFFLFLHTYEVHHPYSPDAADLAPFRGDYRGPLPDLITVQLLKALNAKRGVSEADRQHVVDTYDAEIRSMDRAFGSLIAFLKERRLYDPALVVVTSDHGEEFGEHGMLGWHSHTLYDELLRVPLLVKLPHGQHAGTEVTDVARSIDIAPTLLEILGIPVPAAFEGHDLLATGARPPEADETWCGRDVVEPNVVWCLRTPKWKLLDARLFDLERDPGERTDVARLNPQVAGRLGERRRALLDARPRASRSAARLDPELRERLRSLGYVE